MGFGNAVQSGMHTTSSNLTIHGDSGTQTNHVTTQSGCTYSFSTTHGATTDESTRLNEASVKTFSEAHLNPEESNVVGKNHSAIKEITYSNIPTKKERCKV